MLFAPFTPFTAALEFCRFCRVLFVEFDRVELDDELPFALLHSAVMPWMAELVELLLKLSFW